MYHLDEITLSNYGVYQDTTFPFIKGLTRVTGRNRSGKSLIFSALQPIMYAADGVPKGGKAVLSGLDGALPFEASVFNHGKSDRYALSIDGVDQQTDTIAKSKDVMSKFFRVSQSVFNTTVMVSSRVPHPLSVGTGSSRLDWIHQTLAFSELYDGYADVVEQEIKRIREKAIQHGLVAEQIADLDKDKPEKPKKMEDIDTSEIAKEIEGYQRKLDKLRLQERLPEKPEFTSDEIEAKLSKLKSKLEKMAEDHDAYETYKARLKFYLEVEERSKSQRELIAKLAKQVGAPEGLSNAKLLAGAKKMREKNQRKLARAVGDLELYEKQSNLRRYVGKKIIVPELKYLPKEARQVDVRFTKVADLDATTKKLTKLMNYYEGASEDMTGECKVCGKDLGEQGEKLTHYAQAIQSMIDALEYNFLVEEAARTTFVEAPDTIPMEDRDEKLGKLIRILENTSDEVKKPKEVEFYAAAYEAAQDKRAELREALSTAKKYEKLVEELGETELLPAKVLKKRITKLDSLIREKSKQMLEISDARVERATAVSLWKRYLKQREDLVAKQDELKQYPKRLKVAMALRKAFGRDGLRVSRLDETLELFLANLNDCAPLIFDEPFKFEIEVGARKCDVIAHRNNKKGSIFTLSTSEVRGWQAIAALAMLRILPNAHRFDTIILDELEANMDEKSIDRFVNSYLPELQKVVPNVIVVTPLSEKAMYIPANNKFVVTKRNGVSKIERIRK